MSRKLERLKQKAPIGTVFGRLSVTGYVQNKHHVWCLECRCTCGNSTVQRRDVLARRATVSCGCYIREKITRYGIHKRLPPGQSQLNSLFSRHGFHCTKRKLTTSLAKEDFHKLITSNCHYCKIPPSAEFTQSYVNGTFLYGGVDRLDSSAGYTTLNCVPCCKICNAAKNNMTVDEFRAWIERVATHFIGMQHVIHSSSAT